VLFKTDPLEYVTDAITPHHQRAGRGRPGPDLHKTRRRGAALFSICRKTGSFVFSSVCQRWRRGRKTQFDEQFRATGKMRGGTVDRAELFRKSGGATSNVKCTTWQGRRVGRVFRPVRKLHGYKCFQQRSVPTCTYTGKGKLT
jgi:hypothetical protein